MLLYLGFFLMNRIAGTKDKPNYWPMSSPYECSCYTHQHYVLFMDVTAAVRK